MRGDPRKTFFGPRGCRCRSFRGCVPFLTHASEWRGANGLIVFYAAGDGRGRAVARSEPSFPSSFIFYIWSECVYTLEIKFLSSTRGSIRCTPAHITPSSVRSSIHAAMMSDEKKPRFPFFFFSSSRPRLRSRRRASLMRVFICAP